MSQIVQSPAPPPASPAEGAPRVDVGGLVRRLLLGLVVPVTLALLVDWQAGTEPLFTLVTALICIPLTSVLVIKAAMRDMDRIIAAVAPPLEDEVASGEGDDEGEASAAVGPQA